MLDHRMVLKNHTILPLFALYQPTTSIPESMGISALLKPEPLSLTVTLNPFQLAHRGGGDRQASRLRRVSRGVGRKQVIGL
jgi:hypothetical protein